MSSTTRAASSQLAGRGRATTLLVCAGVLVLAALLGMRASPVWLGLLVAGLGGLLLFAQPALGVLALTIVALLPLVEINTGTDVNINAASLVIPALALIWLLDGVRRRRISIVRTRANLPLLLFLAAGLASLLIGRVTWNIFVPIDSSFLLVQLAQWAIFAFSALAFWLAANLIDDEAALWRMTALFLLLAGGVAILRLVPGLDGLVKRVVTLAFIRAPLWVLLTALAAGQLFFNHRLSTAWRLFLMAALLGALIYAFVEEQEAVSNWVGLAAALGALLWLRFPRLRIPVLVLVVLMVAAGGLFSTLYDFAGGDQEWQGSGASRLVLIERVVDVTMRNPITGLGPAAYRRYAAMEPLRYGRALWAVPNVNSHNNYVDIFSHTGLVGLVLFLWFMAEVAWLGWRLRRRYQRGFTAGYVNGMLAAWAAMMVIMLLLDWFLPLVYNVGFRGFQASVLVWLFLGGLVALENMPNSQPDSPRQTTASG